MIRSFRHKGIEQFFKTGSKAGIQPPHAKKLRVMLTRLDGAKIPEDMNLPTWQWHPLKGDMTGRWVVSVSGNWRLTYAFEGVDAVLVGYEDYH